METEKIQSQGKTYFVDSCKMSFFKRFSMSSMFSALSDMRKVLRGSEASLSTKDLPEMYTKVIRSHQCRNSGKQDLADQLVLLVLRTKHSYSGSMLRDYISISTRWHEDPGSEAAPSQRH